ncbi:MAG TPA: helix-turn-helix domain-containing protein, partial [Candidatus Nanoarchaeia archaeon]|nr:helix-turn-helix domain-containing protein [Candidatus Nanoarchaeia archaeon]
MWFSKTELEAISQIGNGNKEVPEIAKALKISVSQVYRIAQKLSQKGIVSLKEGILQPEMKTHVNMLLNILSDAVNLSSPLSGTGLQIYPSLLEPKTLKEVE